MWLMIGQTSDKCDRCVWRVLRDPRKRVSGEKTQHDPRDQRDLVTRIAMLTMVPQKKTPRDPVSPFTGLD